MSAILDLQLATDFLDVPKESDIQLWLNTLLSHLQLEQQEITVRIVDTNEIHQLNHQYRGKDKPTNVLSFPFEMPELLSQQDIQAEQNPAIFLGDLVICAQVVADESIAQNKANLDHWAHMIVHGTLHLLGYDHIDDSEAQEMEAMEIVLLEKLAIDDPYQNH